MKYTALFLAFASFSYTAAASNPPIQPQELKQLQAQVKKLEQQISNLEKRRVEELKPISSTKVEGSHEHHEAGAMPAQVKHEQHDPHLHKVEVQHFHDQAITVHIPDTSPEGLGYYPTALMSNDQIITFIAGTPVVSSPYLGDRPAFDGSDYIVNISSINRDIRLMQQRRKLYRAYEQIGYPKPDVPIIALSGKSEPIATLSKPHIGNSFGDINLGSNELDTAAILNQYVEAFMGITYDASPPVTGNQRVSNSMLRLNLGFVNIGDLDYSPIYFTAGQLYAPFGRYASSMVSAPISLVLARTRTRPFILGYKSQTDSGPYAAFYGFITDTNLGHDGTGGVNLGYALAGPGDISGDFGVGFIGSLADSQGMQATGSPPFTTFGGFGSPTNGNEYIRTVPGANVHANLSFDRYSLTAEWVGATKAFRPQDLSFNNHGARPQAGQLEAGVTFKAFDKPASIGIGYQWSTEALALNLPVSRISGVFNMSMWKDTVESLELRRDNNYGANTIANGAAPPGHVNQNTLGGGGSVTTLIAQVGVYF